MDIYRGQVISNTSFDLDTQILVKIPDLGNEQYKVYYTTPYFTANEGGMFAIPEPGNEILVAKEDEDLYYLSTIVKPPEKFIKGTYDKEYSAIKEKYLYTNRFKPQRISFGDTKGNKLVFDARYDKKMISSKTQLESGGGKKVVLDDSPGIDSVIIRNEHGDGLKITSEPTDVTSAQSAELNTRGQQTLVSREATIDINVLDGREVNITNTSTGAKSDGVTGQYGNINLNSKYKDISINADGFNGRIFLNTADCTIQINKSGVLIFSKKDVKIHTIESVDIKSLGRINLEGSEVNIKSIGQINLDAVAGTNILGPLPANLVMPVPVATPAGPGTTVPINPAAPPVIPVTPPEIKLNDYLKPIL